MDFENFTQKLDRLNAFVSDSEILARDDGQRKRDCNILPDSEAYKGKKSDLEQEGRLLKVGILGRVKAGKSSFLNALLFDGKDILPKAATPMTAALCVLEYAPKPSVEIEFYNENDIQSIKEYADQYQRQLGELKQQKQKDLQSRRMQKTLQEIEEMAHKQAQIELKKSAEVLHASFEQYEMIKKSNISQSELEAEKTFDATSLESLKERLKEFVGSKGKYMPYTKSITLRLNEPLLENVQIIDTPGLNDPVPSRSKRTLEFLDRCDCAFVLTPAGQFADSNDMNLLDKLEKNAVVKAYLIASKVDIDLYGSEKKPNLDDTLKGIQTKLKGSIAKTLQKKNIEEVILNSNICVGINDNPSEGQLYALNQLRNAYPNDFNEANTESSLEKLSNKKLILNIFKDIKTAKEEILRKKLEETLKTDTENIEKYKQSLLDKLRGYRQKLESTDVESLQDEIKNLKIAKDKGKSALENEYMDSCDALENRLSEHLLNERREFFKVLEKKAESQVGTGSRTYSTSKWYNPFSWGSTETTTFTTVNAGAVRAAIMNTCEKLEELLTYETKKEIDKWRQKIRKELLETLRKKVEDKHIDAETFIKAIRLVTDAIDIPRVDYASHIPDELQKSGKLTGWEADEFIESVEKFANNFKNKSKKDIDNFIQKLKSTLRGYDLGSKIFDHLEQNLETLEKDLETKNETLKKYQKLEGDIEEC